MLFETMNNIESRADRLCSDEERLLVSRATELFRRVEKNAVASSFLTPREQRTVFEAVQSLGGRDSLFMWGGYLGAERRKAIFLPSWLREGVPCPYPLFSRAREEHFLSLLSDYGMTDILSDFIFALELSGSGYAAISHRDWLGSLLGLGLKRSVLGDICPLGPSATLFCEETAAQFICEELRKAGRDTVKAKAVSVGADFSYERSYDEIVTTVQSPRLDGIIRALLNVSREEAQSIVSSGAADVNYYTKKEPDTHLSKGDILSVRGFGKYIIDQAEGTTRRGRIRLIARKYK